MNMNNNNNVRYNERELTEKDPKANTKICFEVRVKALRSRLHTEEFQLSTKDRPQRDLHIGITNTNREYITPALTILYTRGRH